MRVREYLGVSDTAELIAMLATLVVRLPVGDIVKWRRKRERVHLEDLNSKKQPMVVVPVTQAELGKPKRSPMPRMC